MANGQNIESKTLASKIDTAYGSYMVDWHVSPRKSLLLINVQESRYWGIDLAESSLNI